MGRRRTLEDRLARLSELRSDPASETTRQELRSALKSKSQHLAAKAAKLVAELGLDEVIPDLVAAFGRFSLEPAKSDKGCFAKTAIVKALYAMEHHEEEVFLRGVRHVQMEPAYGGPVDTAVELRSTSALALAFTGHPDAVLELVDLLVDGERAVRLAAIEALSSAGRVEAETLLRLKARCGDPEPEVVGECLAALLRLEPSRSQAFVAGFLDSDDLAVAEAATLALGGSRQESAFGILEALWQSQIDPRLRKTVLLALAMLRREPALELLLSLVETAAPPRAADALAALALHRHDEGIRRRAAAAVERRDDPHELDPVFQREFRIQPLL